MIVAIVQARMSSSRLPGKAMIEVCGKPLTAHLLERLRRSKIIERIILATSVDTKNDVMCDYVKSLGFDVFRGSEADVLERCYLAVKPYNPDHVVRVTGDCPLIDPALCDRLFQMYLDKNLDYAEFSQDYAEGADCEIFTFKAFEEAYHKAKLKSEREHITMYLNNHSDQFKKEEFPNETNDSHYRFTLDEPEDLDVIKAIFERLYKSEEELFTYSQIKDYLDSNPEIMKKNAHIIRNEGLAISLKSDEVLKG